MKNKNKNWQQFFFVPFARRDPVSSYWKLEGGGEGRGGEDGIDLTYQIFATLVGEKMELGQKWSQTFFPHKLCKKVWKKGLKERRPE